jgi:hypothetical protein
VQNDFGPRTARRRGGRPFPLPDACDRARGGPYPAPGGHTGMRPRYPTNPMSVYTKGASTSEIRISVVAPRVAAAPYGCGWR